MKIYWTQSAGFWWMFCFLWVKCSLVTLWWHSLFFFTFRFKQKVNASHNRVLRVHQSRISSFSAPPKLSKTHQCVHWITLSFITMNTHTHTHAHTHCSLFWLNPTHGVPLPQILSLILEHQMWINPPLKIVPNECIIFPSVGVMRNYRDQLFQVILMTLFNFKLYIYICVFLKIYEVPLNMQSGRLLEVIVSNKRSGSSLSSSSID